MAVKGLNSVGGKAEKEMYARSLETERDAYRELVKQLKHNIYCNNIANLMYMLCTERRKCFLEQTQIVANYERKILVMENTKEQMTFDLDEMKKECDKLMLKIKIREECMTRVLEQFQKFINFALRAVPAQAEFLLDMNKMMTFELTQAIAKLGHVHPVKQVMPWQAVKVPDVRVMTSEMDDLGDKYHDCLNEEDPPQNDDDEITSDEVYSVKYKKKLYVREDFRNMISNGEEITATNMIWNKDVENLINLLKNTSIEESIGSLNKEIKSQVSNVHFNANPKLPNNGSFGIGLLAAQDSIELQKSGKVSHSLSSEVYIKQPSCAILASTDSLTIVKNVERAPSKLTDDRSKELIVKHFSCDTINLSVSRKNRDRASMDSPCATISEETFKLGSRRKYKVCEEVCEKFNDKATSTGLLNEQEETYKIESNQELHSSSRKKKKFESLLVLHKDSLELTRSAMHVEESRFKDIVRAGPLYKSGVCLLNMPIADIVQDIDFEPVAKVYRYHTVHPNKPEVAQTTPSIKEEEVEKPAERDNFLEKPGVAKVLGRHGREHLQTNQEFTVHRIHSIVDMLKKDDSLIRMFTRCNQ